MVTGLKKKGGTSHMIDLYDIAKLQHFLKLAKEEGTDSIRIVQGPSTNSYLVTIIPKPAKPVMRIAIERSEPLQQDRPGAAHLLLIGSNDVTKAVISVYPVMKPAEKFSEEEFHFQLHVGQSTISPDADIRLIIK